MDELIGRQVGDRYQIQSLLGKQKGRRTFLARDSEHRQLVVVKLVLFGPDFTWEDIKLFERETQVLKSLEHIAIPRYLDSFELEAAQWKGFALVQSYIEARSLQSWVQAGRTFQENELRAIATQLLNILDYLHSQHPAVIHRDIKPSNILLGESLGHSPAQVHLVDFGSVHTVASNGTMTIVGTYGYMPPEQFGGKALPASDLYSLGATLIYLMTGQHPADLIQDDLKIKFDSDRLSPEFSTWIQQLICLSLSERTSSAAAALQQLNQPSRPTTKDISLLSASSQQISQARGAIASSPERILSRPKSCQLLTYNDTDLALSFTAHSFELKFSEHRIVRNRLQQTGGCWPLLLALGSICLFGAALFSSLIMVIIAFSFLSAIPSQLGTDQQPQNDKSLSLKIWLLEDGSELVSVHPLVDEPLGDHPQGVLSSEAYGSNALSEKSSGYSPKSSQLSRLKLKTITLLTSAIGQDTQLIFNFFKEPNQPTDQLILKGSQFELSWLRNELQRWRVTPIEEFERL